MYCIYFTFTILRNVTPDWGRLEGSNLRIELYIVGLFTVSICTFISFKCCCIYRAIFKSFCRNSPLSKSFCRHRPLSKSLALFYLTTLFLQDLRVLILSIIYLFEVKHPLGFFRGLGRPIVEKLT